MVLIWCGDDMVDVELHMWVITLVTSVEFVFIVLTRSKKFVWELCIVFSEKVRRDIWLRVGLVMCRSCELFNFCKGINIEILVIFGSV